jgi:hypothetical protein
MIIFFYLLILLISIGFSIFISNQYFLYQQKPTPEKIASILQKFSTQFRFRNHLSEAELESILAKVLQRYFKNVKTQVSMQGRERIDIDIDNQVGIEVKLAKLLKKTNERNRLLGQMDLYRSRKYINKTLLAVIAGSPSQFLENHILELEKLLNQKNVRLIKLKLTQNQDECNS